MLDGYQASNQSDHFVKAWQVWHLAVVWLAGTMLVAALVAFDVRRVAAFAIPVPRAGRWHDRLPAVRALARMLPIAVGAVVVIPMAVVGVTIWWIVSRP